MYIQAYTFDIVHRPGKKHANVYLLSRPVQIAEANVTETENVDDSSEKLLDPWDDEFFLYFMIFKKHKQGSSKSQVKKVEKLSQFYKLVDNRLFYRKSTDDDYYSLENPPKSRGKSIIMDSHLLGHFQAQTTYDRLNDKYYWKHMFETIKQVIEACLTCIRHH